MKTVPSSGGYLTGKYLEDGIGAAEPGSHFDPNWAYGGFYISRYSPTVSHVRELQSIARKYELGLGEVAVRWLMHHSLMRPEDHGVILGASRVEQLEKSLLDW